ncbi:hypothetical protein LTR62_007734 [Meristemomyces frigidus]|uniref:DUF1746 domain-containing protein n=1 Tax=Meristemomyces frigidus TaxID=1508187 RepID=A0AAN7TE78_9PEZI|nr:hypothetical protein LTR62_007734 [Meristemomyces frigidus]
MSEEASSSAAAYTPEHTQHASFAQTTPSPAQVAEQRKTNRQLFNRKRGDLLDDVLKNLDMLIYAELSAVYYMEYIHQNVPPAGYTLTTCSCSFIRFVLRGLVQFILLTPKPTSFPEPPFKKPYIGFIFGSNILCILLHILYAAPTGSEATRGYLHGGLAMDFIGQKGPSSKIHLVLLDILVVLLQLVHLSAHFTRLRLKDNAVSVTTTTGRQYAAQATGQNHDAEERGVRRSGEQQDVEMQALNPSGAAVEVEQPASEETVERNEDLLASTSARTDAHIFNAFNSGQIVLADLDIIATVKEQFWAYATTTTEASPSMIDMRRNIIGQLIRWRAGAVPGRPAERIV